MPRISVFCPTECKRLLNNRMRHVRDCGRGDVVGRRRQCGGDEQEQETRQTRPETVWPDDEIKSSPKFSKRYPKSAHNSFY